MITREDRRLAQLFLREMLDVDSPYLFDEVLDKIRAAINSGKGGEG